MDIDVKVDTSELERALKQFPHELKRATRNALNDTARDVQKAERGSLGREFDLRRGKTFLERQVYIGPGDKATTDKLESAVQVKQQGGSQLHKYEEGEERTPARAETMPVPLPAIVDKGGHVKRGFSLKALGPFVSQGPTSKLKRVRGKLVQAGRGQTRTQKVGKRGTFIGTLKKSGLSAVLQGSKAGLRVLYLFLPRVKLPPALQFVEGARRTAATALPKRAAEAIEHALRRAGLK